MIFSCCPKNLLVIDGGKFLICNKIHVYLHLFSSYTTNDRCSSNVHSMKIEILKCWETYVAFVFVLNPTPEPFPTQTLARPIHPNHSDTYSPLPNLSLSLSSVAVKVSCRRFSDCGAGHRPFLALLSVLTLTLISLWPAIV